MQKCIEKNALKGKKGFAIKKMARAITENDLHSVIAAQRRVKISGIEINIVQDHKKARLADALFNEVIGRPVDANYFFY